LKTLVGYFFLEAGTCNSTYDNNDKNTAKLNDLLHPF
jgi:hypothetical protein